MPSREENEHTNEDRAPDTEYEYANDNEDAESVSVEGSEAEEREAAKEAPGVDMRAAPREHSGLYVMVFFIIFSVISFVFMLTSSTTISWYKASNGDSWTLWKSPNGTEWKDYPCEHKKQIFQAMEAFTISGCVLSLACVVAGVLQVVGAGHMGVSLGLSFLTMSINLVAWALGVHQYHKYNCPGEIAFVDKINRLQAGFCLTIISFALMLFAFLELVYYFYAYYSWTETARAKKNGAALTSALLIGGCLTIATVGSAFTMWEDYSSTHKLKVTLWHVEVLSQETGLSEYVSFKNYNCDELNKYFQAGEAFAILGAAFLFFTLLFAVGTVYSRACKWVTFALGVASWVFLLVCWAIMIGARYKSFCPDGLPIVEHHGLKNIPINTDEQQVNFMGFVITEGLGMIISAWCAMSVIVIYLAVKA